MSENLNSNNIESNEFNLNDEDSDYKYLITRLKEIKLIISLLGNIMNVGFQIFLTISYLVNFQRLILKMIYLNLLVLYHDLKKMIYTLDINIVFLFQDQNLKEQF